MLSQSSPGSITLSCWRVAPTLLFVLVATVWPLAACSDGGSSSSSSTSSGSGGGGATTAVGGGGSSSTSSTSSGGGEGPTCPPTAPAHPGSEDYVGIVQGTVQDLQGTAAANILSDVCGTNMCLSGKTNGQGSFFVDDGQTNMLEDVRLLWGAGLTFIKMSAELPSMPDADFGVINTVRLPDFAQGADLTEGDNTQGDVTLTIAAGASIDIDGILYSDAAQRGFRTVSFKPSDGNFPSIDDSLGLVQLYGLAPINTDICPAATMTVPNDAGWPANAAVEFYFHGTKTFAHWAPYGGWAKVSDGTVSGDGATVSTNDGEGIPELGLVGIKLKP